MVAKVSSNTLQSLDAGNSYPLGATYNGEGVNFSVFAEFAENVDLLFFDHEDDGKPSRVIKLEPKLNHTFNYWHIYVQGIKPGQRYGYRVRGPFDPHGGHRFDGDKLLIDPYGKALATPAVYDPKHGFSAGDNAAYAMKSVVIDRRDYDWEGDQLLNQPYNSLMIYELHVGGFTKSPSSCVAKHKRGTFAGLVQKIPYLKSLGINCVELMPVQQFEEHSFQPRLSNYWGYNPISFFVPHMGFSSNKDPLGVVDEFRDMVKALHQAGISVILDVVFNHTSEGNELGPTQSFKGFSNRVYYLLSGDRRYYSNFSGCGNTLNANRSVVRRLILDCLKYWVAEMHVDGFRFDLASTFSRDEFGSPLANSPILWDIETDPVLASAKIIAEPWDAAGLYEVGSFAGHRWSEWNGRFRDDIRRFVKSDDGMTQHLAARLTGSSDLFSRPGSLPNRSINFITCHDGFTLHDLVSYNEKHNLENGEGNKDGADANFSWNCGVEGATDDAGILTLRKRQMKNLMTLLMISEGTPMLLMGDEVMRSQNGNNNAWCQDNETSWFNWTTVKENDDMLRFVKMLIESYKQLEVFQLNEFWMAPACAVYPHLTWHGAKLYQPDWGAKSRTLAFTLNYIASGDHLHVMINAHWEKVFFEVPLPGSSEIWYRVVDTYRDSPDDFMELSKAPAQLTRQIQVQSRSIVILKTQKRKVGKDVMTRAGK